MNVIKLTKEQVAFTKEHYVHGNSHFGIFALARMFGVDYRTLLSAIKNKNNYPSKELIQFIIDHYVPWNHHFGISSLAKITGFSKKEVENIIKKYGD